ncbi:MAG: corrinoid protein [Candidatus Helarchaeota archaeon]|nr:corrinoid protein [Candidatus Helarchaeota archaeon]
MSKNDLFKELSGAIINGDEELAEQLARKSIKLEINPIHTLENCVIPAMEVVGKKFEKQEFFIPEILIAARAMEYALKILKPEIEARRKREVSSVKEIVVVLGTVKGDIHDIGKNLVKYFMEGAGFKVFDLGTEVSVERFIQEIKTRNADLLCMSALISTTMPYFRKVIVKLEAEGLRNKVKVMVGGAPVTEEYAKKVKADAYAEDAFKAIQIGRLLVEEGK